MKVKLIAAGACRDDGEITQVSGCGVVLLFIDEHGREQTREFGWALGGYSANMADVMASRIALSSVLPQFRIGETVLVINSEYVHTFLTEKAKSDIFEISELLRWFSYYPKITVANGSEEEMARAVELAEEALESQENYDSGTSMDE